MTEYTFGSNITTKIDFRQAKTPRTNNLTIVYLHGLYSDCWGRKPESIADWCQEHGFNFFRYELAGHGSDSSHYEEVDFNIWKEQLLEVLDKIVKTDVVLMGSSLGGWLSLIGALNRPEQVKGVIGLAAAPDFTLDLEKYIFTPEQTQTLYEKGRLEFPMKDFTYVFTKKMFETAKQNRLLDKTLEIKCPVHLIQGQKDANILPDKALKIAQCLTSDEVVIKLIKDGNHRLGTDTDISEILNTLESLLSRILKS